MDSLQINLKNNPIINKKGARPSLAPFFIHINMARIKKETESPIEEFINEPVEEQDNELVTPAPQVIPDNIDRILKMYPGYEKLYIDSKGGAYTSQQPNAHIYENPYYNK